MASVLKVDKLDPQSGTALEIGTSGDTVSIPSGATLDISASTLTPPATMPASSGINFTALNATNLGSGTVPTARLGTGTASSSTVLYGDQTYKAEPSGKIVQTKMEGNYNWSGDASSSSVTYAGFGNEIVITPTSSSNALIFHMMVSGAYASASEGIKIGIYDETNSTWVSGAEAKKVQLHFGSTVNGVNTPITLMEILETAGSGARTYKGYYASAQAGETIYINNNGSTGFVRFCIMEVVKDD
jgi:hypothetical protein